MKRAIASLGIATMLLAACSGGGSGEPSSSPSTPGLYTDARFGYTLRYEPPFEVGTGNGVGNAGVANNPAAESVSFYDSSVKVGGSSSGAPGTSSAPSASVSASGSATATGSVPPTDSSASASADATGSPAASSGSPSATQPAEFFPVTLTVSVFPLREAVTPSNLDEAKAQLEDTVLPQLQPGGSSQETLSDTKVADRPAFSGTATVPAQATPIGKPLHTEYYFVFSGTDQYQISLQAPEEQWQQVEPKLQAMLDTLTLPAPWPAGSESPSSSASQSTVPSASAASPTP